MTGRKGNPTARVRKAYVSKGDDVTLSRWVKVERPHAPRQAELLTVERVVSPALLRRPWVVAGRSKFHAKGVKPVDGHVLVSGHSNVKIGRDVRKGWATCYGNNMPYAKRIDHSDRAALEAAICADVERLTSVRGRVGVMVRLHALGDFYSAPYVRFWSALLRDFPTLAVYGYTAWGPTTDIGKAVMAAKREHGRRFAVRWSNGRDDEDCAIPVRSIDEPVNAIVCPEQTGATVACATCGLCWGTSRNIAFLEH